jgi:hypothetical protein
MMKMTPTRTIYEGLPYAYKLILTLDSIKPTRYQESRLSNVLFLVGGSWLVLYLSAYSCGLLFFLSALTSSSSFDLYSLVFPMPRVTSPPLKALARLSAVMVATTMMMMAVSGVTLPHRS